MKFKTLIAAGLALGAMILPANAMATAEIQTPTGFMPAQPSTVAPVVERYAGTEALLSVGTARTDGTVGLSLSGTVDLPATYMGSCHAADYEVDLVDPNQWNRLTGVTFGQSCVSGDSTSLDGVVLTASPACVASTISGCVITMPAQLELVVMYNDHNFTGNYIGQVLGTITPATYSPVASVVGDPNYTFKSAFRANSVMVIRKPNGTLTKRIGLGTLKAGKHTIHFACTKGKTRYVHVIGTALDGAHQVSPTRKAHC